MLRPGVVGMPGSTWSYEYGHTRHMISSTPPAPLPPPSGNFSFCPPPKKWPAFTMEYVCFRIFVNSSFPKYLHTCSIFSRPRRPFAVKLASSGPSHEEVFPSSPWQFLSRLATTICNPPDKLKKKRAVNIMGQRLYKQHGDHHGWMDR